MSMTSMIEAANKVNSILEYLGRYERHAELTNRRNDKHHFQECWALVFSVFYGEVRVPHCTKAKESAATFAPPAVTGKPKWFIEKYSRPLRRVVSSSEGFDLLVCGHQVANWGDIAKHRRCKECKSLPPKEDTRSRVYATCKKVDKALGQIPRKVAGVAGLGKKLKADEGVA